MDAQGWAIVISAIGMVVTQVVQMILSYLRDARAAAKMNTIKTDLAENTELTSAVKTTVNGQRERLEARLEAYEARAAANEKRLAELTAAALQVTTEATRAAAAAAAAAAADKQRESHANHS